MAVITHVVSLDHACAHCPRFLTAALNRSPGVIAIPVWLIVLSDQLWIVGLVRRYHTNYHNPTQAHVAAKLFFRQNESLCLIRHFAPRRSLQPYCR
jgi:hypothetical protein